MNCTCNSIYVRILAGREKPRLLHDDRCIRAAEQALDIDLQVRIAWERGENCTIRTSHKAHGKCSGLTFDRT